jgi:hypothetical protein
MNKNLMKPKKIQILKKKKEIYLSNQNHHPIKFVAPFIL